MDHFRLYMIVVDCFHTAFVEHNEDLAITIGCDYVAATLLVVWSLLLQAQALTT